eukprot:TRINITY_DN8896_c0_g1_i1.p1 TRINITY_DN8896_c0_g1~~TRINITY_DN8896_c0_g1_i1.p1  ORF type:complete len:806 (-),score=166.97 TRINITY_DN8896_c0_g1_i1:183-2600(-)
MAGAFATLAQSHGDESSDSEISDGGAKPVREHLASTAERACPDPARRLAHSRTTTKLKKALLRGRKKVPPRKIKGKAKEEEEEEEELDEEPPSKEKPNKEGGSIDEDDEEEEEDEGEVDVDDAIFDVDTLREDRGVVIHAPQGEKDATHGSFRPVLCFEELLQRGVASELIDRCRLCAGGSSRPTAVQAECWGLLLSPVEPAADSKSSDVSDPIPIPSPVVSRQQPKRSGTGRLRPEDVPLPTDSESEEDAKLVAKQREAGRDQPTASGGCVLSKDLCVEKSAEKTAAGRCLVQEAVDLIGVAPTGSGKTLAFLLPLLADGLCAVSHATIKLDAMFNQFVELFGQSFNLDSPGSKALLKRCDKLIAKSDGQLLTTTMLQVASKATSGKDAELAAHWRKFQANCAMVGLAVPLALVLSPTRELAQQVGEVARSLGASSAVVIGGFDHESQRAKLLQESPALIIATPGRLLALCGETPTSMRKRGNIGSSSRGGGDGVQERPVATVALGGIARLVMDEGDRLLDEGFFTDVGTLARLAERRRQAMLFTATWSSETESLAKVLRPSVVRVTVSGIPRTIEQRVELIPKAARARRLRSLLREFRHKKVLVFVLFKKEAQELARMLAEEGFEVAGALQGNMSQSARSAALQRFRDAASESVLVATDVAARGLDVGGVSHVINFSLGLSIDSYVHRIGRCGRAGRRGTAVTFMTDGDARFAAPLQKLLRESQQPVPPGLSEMAAVFERHAGMAHLEVKHSSAQGEVKLVVRNVASVPSEVLPGAAPVAQWQSRRDLHPRRNRAAGSLKLGA